MGSSGSSFAADSRELTLRVTKTVGLLVDDVETQPSSKRRWVICGGSVPRWLRADSLDLRAGSGRP